MEDPSGLPQKSHDKSCPQCFFSETAYELLNFSSPPDNQEHYSKDDVVFLSIAAPPMPQGKEEERWYVLDKAFWESRFNSLEVGMELEVTVPAVDRIAW